METLPDTQNIAHRNKQNLPLAQNIHAVRNNNTVHLLHNPVHHKGYSIWDPEVGEEWKQTAPPSPSKNDSSPNGVVLQVYIL